MYVRLFYPHIYIAVTSPNPRDRGVTGAMGKGFGSRIYFLGFFELIMPCSLWRHDEGWK